MKYPRHPRRPGYAMLLVLAFLILLMAFWGIAFRQTSALLRVEKARSGMVTDPSDLPKRALAIALTLLETGDPGTYYSGTLSVMNMAGAKTFLVTFTKDTTDDPGHYNWIVTVSANLGDNPPPPLPATF